jgi:uncharacterized LabA/DUF88 family protein
MSRIILIDGENFLYGLRALAGKNEQLAPRELFTKFPFKALIDEVMGDEQPAQILYYGAKLREYNHTPELLLKTKAAIKFQLKLANTLKKQGINLIKVGYLRARESDPCPKCGQAEWRLLEKGVDVGLAVRLVLESKPEADLVLISSDTDLLPAVKSAIHAGSKITYIGYETQPILSLIKESSLHRVITAPMVRKYLKDSK